MTEDQIKHMTQRFLQWRLPANFNPDCGISYTVPNSEPYIDGRMGPVGTNLFDAVQAEAMVRHMVEGAPLSNNGPEREAALEEAALMADRFNKHHDVAPMIAGWIRHLKTDPDAGKGAVDAQP